MIRLVAFIVLHLSSFGAITLVQHRTTTTATSLAFSSNTTAGNTLALEIEQNSNSGTTPITITSISDTGSNTWSLINRTHDTLGGNLQEVEIWCAGNVAGGADTVTIVNSSAAAYNSIYIQEWSGLRAGISCSSLIDVSAINNATTGGTATTSALTVTTGELVLCVAMFNAGSIAAGSGYTSIDTDTFSMGLYKVAASGSETPTATGTSGQWAIVGTALKIPSGLPSNQFPRLQ